MSTQFKLSHWLRSRVQPSAPRPESPPEQPLCDQLTALHATLSLRPPATPELLTQARQTLNGLEAWLDANTSHRPGPTPENAHALLSQLVARWSRQGLAQCELELSPALHAHLLGQASANAIIRACDDLLSHNRHSEALLSTRMCARVDEVGWLHILIAPLPGAASPGASDQAAWRLLEAQGQLMALGGRLSLQDGSTGKGEATVSVPLRARTLVTALTPP